MLTIEWAVAWSLLNVVAVILSSSCFFRSSENPACSIFLRAERPPSSIACSVISDNLRAIALSSLDSSCDCVVSLLSFAFESAFRRWLIVEKHLDLGLFVVDKEDMLLNLKAPTCRLLISANIKEDNPE